MQLLVATALAGILAASMLALFYQLTKQRTVVDNRMSVIGRAMLCTQQMARDISGTFLPLPFDAQQEQTDQVSTTTPQNQQQKNSQQQTPAAQSPKPEEKKEEPQHIFYAKERDGMLDMLSVITTNPLQVYWSEQVGKPKPRVARVVYRVEVDDKEKQSYKLTRQEAATLELAPFEKKRDGDFRPYTLINGIKSLKAIYYYLPPQEPEKKPAPGAQPKEKTQPEAQESKESTEKLVYEQAREWIVRKNEREQEGEKKKLPMTPSYVELHIDLWDERFEKSHEYTYTIPIMAEVEKVGRIRRVRESARLLQQAQAQNKPAQPAKLAQQNNRPLTAPKQAQLTRPAHKNTGAPMARNTARPQAPKRPVRT